MAPNTSFLPVIDDVSIKKTECVSRVCFMSGKIYYDLFRERESKKSESEIALIRYARMSWRQASFLLWCRIEEICPAPMSHIRQLIQKYSHVIDWVWVQEEPENNGSFLYFEPRIRSLLSPGCKLRYQGRPPTSAVATGITKVHKEQHKQIIEGALSLEIEK